MKLLVGLLSNTYNNLLTFMTDNKDNIPIHIIHKDTQTHIETDKHIDRQTDRRTDGLCDDNPDMCFTNTFKNDLKTCLEKWIA